jgi:hypothetical protein
MNEIVRCERDSANDPCRYRDGANEANNSWSKSMLGNPPFALKLGSELMDAERPAAAADAGSLRVACIRP